MAYSKARRLAEIVSDVNGNISVEGIVVPTQSASDNDTSAASTAFVTTALNGLVDSAPGTLNTLNEIAAALNDDANFNTTVTNSIAAKAPIESPTFTTTITTPDINITGGSQIGQDFAYLKSNSTSTASLTLRKDSTGADSIDFLQLRADGNGLIGKIEGDGDISFKAATFTGTVNDLTLAASGISGNSSNNFALNTPHSFRLNIDSDNSATGESFIVGNNQTAVNQSNVLFKVQEDGKVGIGTSNPLTPLHVVGANGLLLDTEGNGDGSVYFGGISGTDRSYIARSSDDLLMWNVSNGHTRFGTNNAERMRINNLGNVGIGTQSPVSFGTNSLGLTINSTGNYPNLLLQKSGVTQFYCYLNGTGGTFIGTSVNQPLMLMANDSEKMRIQGTGLVGIGTNAPDTQLHVKGTNASAGDLYTAVGPGNVPSITIQNDSTTNNNNAALFFKDNDGHVASIAARFVSHTSGDEKVQLRFGVTGSGNTREKMTLTEDGHLGIGTVAPNFALQVHKASTGSNYIQITNNDTGSASGDGFIVGVASDEAATIWNYESTPMIFGVSGAAKARFLVNGQFCVNNTGGSSSGSAGIVIGDVSTSAYRHNYGWNGGLYWYNGSNEANLSSGGAWNNASDERLKENIVDIPYGTTELKLLKPKKYTMKEGGEVQIGLIAQDVEAVIPELVTTGGSATDMKSLSYGNLTALLIKTIQELEARITTLEG